MSVPPVRYQRLIPITIGIVVLLPWIIYLAAR
jgi:hypothetical protein